MARFHQRLLYYLFNPLVLIAKVAQLRTTWKAISRIVDPRLPHAASEKPSMRDRHKQSVSIAHMRLATVARQKPQGQKSRRISI